MGSSAITGCKVSRRVSFVGAPFECDDPSLLLTGVSIPGVLCIYVRVYALLRVLMDLYSFMWSNPPPAKTAVACSPPHVRQALVDQRAQTVLPQAVLALRHQQLWI